MNSPVVQQRKFIVRMFKISNGRGVAQEELTGHTATINCLLELGNGTLISGADDNNIRYWQGSPRKCVQVSKQAHAGPITSLAAASGNRFVSVALDGRIKVWNAQRPAIGVTLLKSALAFESGILCLAISSDMTIAVGSAADSTVSLWNGLNDDGDKKLVHTATLAHQREGADSALSILALTYLSDGTLLSSGEDKDVAVWQNNTAMARLRHPAAVASLCALSSGQFVAGCSDGTVKVWQ